MRQNPSPAPFPAGLALPQGRGKGMGGAGDGREGGHTLPGQHSDGDAGVTELDEGAALAVSALAGQEEVFSAHISVDQIFILLQSEKAELSKVAHGAALLPTVSCFPQVIIHIPQPQPDPGSLALLPMICVTQAHYITSLYSSSLISEPGITMEHAS